jgi:hypothetical protein
VICKVGAWEGWDRLGAGGGVGGGGGGGGGGAGGGRRLGGGSRLKPLIHMRALTQAPHIDYLIN